MPGHGLFALLSASRRFFLHVGAASSVDTRTVTGLFLHLRHLLDILLVSVVDIRLLRPDDTRIRTASLRYTGLRASIDKSRIT